MATVAQRVTSLESRVTKLEGLNARVAKLESLMGHPTLLGTGKPPVPPVIPSSNGPNLTNLLTNTTVYSQPGTAKPGYLVETIDPVFGTKVIRISGTPGTSISGISGGVWGDCIHHQYSKVAPWNCDESLFYFETNKEGGGSGPFFINGQTYAPLFASITPPTNGGYDCTRWHPTNPDLMYYIHLGVFGTWNVRTGVKTTIRTFSGYDTSGSGVLTFGQGEGNLSKDGTCVVLDGVIGGTRKCFKYNIATDTKSPDIAHDADNTCITADNQYICWGWGDDRCEIRDPANGALVRTILQNAISHFDHLIDANGDAIMVGRSNGAGGAHPGLCRIRVSDGLKTSLTGQLGYPSHTSARSVLQYAYCDHNDDSGTYTDEIDMANVNTAVMYRLCHKHNQGNGDGTNPGYDAEAHPCPSPGGGRVAFCSIWDGNETTYRPAQMYVCDFR